MCKHTLLVLRVAYCSIPPLVAGKPLPQAEWDKVEPKSRQVWCRKLSVAAGVWGSATAEC